LLALQRREGALCAAAAVSSDTHAHEHNKNRCGIAMRYLLNSLFFDSENEFAVMRQPEFPSARLLMCAHAPVQSVSGFESVSPPTIASTGYDALAARFCCQSSESVGFSFLFMRGPKRLECVNFGCPAYSSSRCIPRRNCLSGRSDTPHPDTRCRNLALRPRWNDSSVPHQLTLDAHS
jgi:hypothetical protein